MRRGETAVASLAVGRAVTEIAAPSAYDLLRRSCVDQNANRRPPGVARGVRKQFMVEERIACGNVEIHRTDSHISTTHCQRGA